VNSSPPPVCLLFDNGSLRAESTRNLRTIAARLGETLGQEVKAVSLLHSSSVAPADLDGRPAELLEPALLAALKGGAKDFVLLPLFFGPSAALTDYVPKRLAHLKSIHPQLQARLAAPLVDIKDAGDTRIAAILAEQVRRLMVEKKLASPAVVLADHGSPQRSVTAVRDFLGGQLGELLGADIGSQIVASMECRPGPVYAFAQPLLADALRGLPAGDVVVALQFLSPGRHAGPGGDITRICADAEQGNPGLRTHLTELVGADPRLIAVLADRYRAALDGPLS